MLARWANVLVTAPYTANHFPIIFSPLYGRLALLPAARAIVFVAGGRAWPHLRLFSLCFSLHSASPFSLLVVAGNTGYVDT